jgi:hypothetical protein
MSAASHEEQERPEPVSKTDAPTQGFIDTMKRRHVSPSQTQRAADIEQAEAEGEWTPTEKDDARPSQSKPSDASGVHAEGVVDESMEYMPRP